MQTSAMKGLIPTLLLPAQPPHLPPGDHLKFPGSLYYDYPFSENLGKLPSPAHFNLKIKSIKVG